MIKQGSEIKVQINDSSIVYDDKGNGNVPLIFIHGFPLTKEMWKYQVDELSATIRCISLDLRGYGASAKGHEELTINLFAEDLVAFMDRLEIKKAIICGLSMGGYIALNALQRFPERFSAAILCNTQCIADTDEAKESRFKTIDAIKEGKKSAFGKAMTEKMLSPDSINHKELTAFINAMILNQDDEVICNTLKALAGRWESCTLLAGIKIPVMIVCGEDDKISPVERHQYMNDHIKNSRLHILPKAGHLTPLEQPELFNKLILDFVKHLAL